MVYPCLQSVIRKKGVHEEEEPPPPHPPVPEYAAAVGVFCFASDIIDRVKRRIPFTVDGIDRGMKVYYVDFDVKYMYHLETFGSCLLLAYDVCLTDTCNGGG